MYDRLSMAYGLELRLPFLDHRLVDFCLRLPNRFLYRRGQSKWILRQSLRGLVPDAVLDRPDKVGFTTPWSEWWADPVVGSALRARLDDAQRTLQPWLSSTVPAAGSSAALDVLALASMQRSLGRSSQEAPQILVEAAAG